MRLPRDERGETLVELLITIIVIGIGLVAVVGMLGSTIVASDAHQSMADAEVIVRDYADAVKANASVAKTSAQYMRCPDANWFKTGVSYAPPTSTWHVDVTNVEYWIPGTFPNGTFQGRPACVDLMEPACGLPDGGDVQTCDPRFDPGYWRLTLRAFNDRTDYAHEDFQTRILVRRGNRLP
jgi:type II secretory pathway pseudopilin PulG